MPRHSQTSQTDQPTDQPQTDQPQTDQPTDQPTDQASANGASDNGFDFDLTAPVMLDPELTKTSAPQRERSERQQQMDATVAKLHEHWAKVGKPSVWGKMVETKSVATYFVAPDKAGDLRKLINRAGTLHGLRIRYGSEFAVSEKLRERYNLPENYVGRTVVSFAVMDKRPRATTAKPKNTSENTES
ncbi:MAG TPA: hypothetical protein VNB49_10605, partial [Candidatus Dormibacteraeota bacterium]|nr:hypothetical protein [Candidatus Dormibacteraeota bacterium]